MRPNKPIHFITPYPPGGSSDVITRFIGDGVSKILQGITSVQEVIRVVDIE